MSQASDLFVSVVASLPDDSKVIIPFIEETITLLQNKYSNYELVLIDGGIADDTLSAADLMLKKYQCIRLIRLSRNFGSEIAIAAGLETVIGDYVVIMDPDTDPPALIPEMVQESRTGSGIVVGVRKNRSGSSFSVKVGTSAFHWITRKLLKLRLPEKATNFMVLSRQVVNALTRIKDKLRSLRAFTATVGYQLKEFPYEQINRSGKKRKYPFYRAFNDGWDIIVSNSASPLRLMSSIGLFASLLNFFYMIYVVIVNLVKEDVVEGWTTDSLQSACMFFLLFLILTVLSKYIGHIYEEQRERPLYYLQEERNSSVLIADQERRNVVEDPENKV